MRKTTSETRPKVVVLGAGGFVGSAAVRELSSTSFTPVAISRNRVDLADPAAVPRLLHALAGASSVVFAAAITPDVARRKGIDPRQANLTMATNLAACAARQPDLHVVYLSSDAVYGIRDGVFSETTSPAPDDDYGAMHVERETQISDAWPESTAILRLSQVYGPGDTHNAYGPCRFVRQALRSEPIRIFGHGEDGRDHIWIGDVARAIALVVASRFTGKLCVSSGHSPSFAKLAGLVTERVPGSLVEYQPRSMPAVFKRFENQKLQDFGINPIPIKTGIPWLIEELIVKK